MGNVYAVIIAECVHVFLKTLIGGFRPYFLEVCDPDPAQLQNGTGFGQVYYSTDICRQTDKGLLKQAMTSFPSGHAACAFSGLGFLFFYLNGKLKPWSNYRPMSWEVALTLMPLLGALLIACSVLINADHHPHDVVVGSIIGFLSALAVYRAYYAAVWDWRFNHIPLKPRELVEYDLAREENLEGVMLTKGMWKVSHGASRRTGPDIMLGGLPGVNGAPGGQAYRRGSGMANGPAMTNVNAYNTGMAGGVPDRRPVGNGNLAPLGDNIV